MKTEAKLVYASFSGHNESGVSLSIFDLDMREYLDGDNEHKFVCEIAIPVITKADVAEMGTPKLDKEIADHCVAIEMLQSQKKQLLAIEHDGGEMSKLDEFKFTLSEWTRGYEQCECGLPWEDGHSEEWNRGWYDCQSGGE